ncbi:hypothetical protein VKT23_002596 [Stygiomarasmius scandens]|uniref:Nephrocystin 3-like N-terminal domain-containing protein n=1 Tax=Marasmiellus scandens TaxID=2682957 RepID=A0ABR1K4D4_9AGAR
MRTNIGITNTFKFQAFPFPMTSIDFANVSTSYFPYAHDFSVNNSTFNAVSGNQTIHYYEPKETGLRLLYQTIAHVGASHESEARYPPPNCHPGTREAILRDLSNWIREGHPEESEFEGIGTQPSVPTETESNISTLTASDSFPTRELQAPVHWLYGSAGTGKSAIAQTLSELFDVFSVEHRLAASFFFSRSSLTRNNPRYLFTTIAYCLAIWTGDSYLRLAIDEAVQKRHGILGASIEIQYRELVVKPLHVLPQESWQKLPKVVIIDGLDESYGSDSQKRVLKAIMDEITNQAGRLAALFVFLSLVAQNPLFATCLSDITVSPFALGSVMIIRLLEILLLSSGTAFLGLFKIVVSSWNIHHYPGRLKE